MSEPITDETVKKLDSMYWQFHGISKYGDIREILTSCIERIKDRGLTKVSQIFEQPSYESSDTEDGSSEPLTEEVITRVRELIEYGERPYISDQDKADLSAVLKLVEALPKTEDGVISHPDNPELFSILYHEGQHQVKSVKDWQNEGVFLDLVNDRLYYYEDNAKQELN